MSTGKRDADVFDTPRPKRPMVERRGSFVEHSEVSIGDGMNIETPTITQSTVEWVNDNARWHFDNPGDYSTLRDTSEMALGPYDSASCADEDSDEKVNAVVVDLGNGVQAVQGVARFNRTGTTQIDPNDWALQQRIFDRLPISQSDRQKLYRELCEEHEQNVRQRIEQAEQHDDAIVDASCA